jgi:DNA-binding transcriptional ArsR family regulator
MWNIRGKRQLAGATILFAALGDATRLEIVRRLSEGPASISTLAERFEMTRQGVTKHLLVLSAAGVIEGSRDGREHVWTLKRDRLDEARQHLDRIARQWDDVLGRLKSHVERG